MPRAVLARLLALGCAVALACGAPAAGAARAQVTIDVPQGKLKSVRLRHLPRGTQLTVGISVSGSLSVELVSKAQLKSKHPVALVRATLDRTLSFRLVIPRSDDYYLVLDNRRGSEDVRATATVQAGRLKKSPSPPPATPKGGGTLDQTNVGDPVQT